MVRIAGEERLIAAEDAGRYRDALGVMPPSGLPDAFLEGGPESLRQLVLRFAKGRGPFTTGEANERFGRDVVGACSSSSSARSCSCAASCAPAAPSASGAIPTCCAGCGARRSPRCGARSSRSSPRRSRASCRRGTASTAAASLREALVPLQALPLPVALWEAEVLPRRVPGYRPEHLDALCASGEVVWVGAGLDRVALYFREDAAALGRVAGTPRPEGAEHDAVRAALGAALFFDELLDETGLDEAVLCRRCGISSGRARSTNDAWTPLRAGRRFGVPKPERRPRRFSRRRVSGPTATQGRWSRTERLFAAPPERRALAELLLERQGIVTRDGVRAEGIPGGYGAVYAELRALETLGLCRRGYFVEGLGGAQFALGGAVERLRELRERGEEADAIVLAAADPAQPYGAALPWPKRAGARAARVAGAYVVLLGGEAVLYVERGGRSLVPLRDPSDYWLRPAFAALVAHVRGGGAKRLGVERFDGEPVAESDVMPLLVEVGFLAGPRRAVLRA